MLKSISKALLLLMMLAAPAYGNGAISVTQVQIPVAGSPPLIFQDASASVFVPGTGCIRVDIAQTITGVVGYTVGSTPVLLNAQIRTAPNVPGTDILALNLSAVEASATDLPAVSLVSAGSWVCPMVRGTPPNQPFTLVVSF